VSWELLPRDVELRGRVTAVLLTGHRSSSGHLRRRHVHARVERGSLWRTGGGETRLQVLQGELSDVVGK